jgi:hypothetical protein
MRRPTLLLIALFGVAALLAACGGGASGSDEGEIAAPIEVVASDAPSDAPADTGAAAPTPGTDLGACEIVTAAEIQAATGATGPAPSGVFMATPDTRSPGGSQCTYEGDFGKIIVALSPEDGANLYDAAVGAYDDADLMSGLGDGAFDSKANNRAFIWKGAVTVMLTMFLNGADQKAVAQSLGEAIVAKL